MNTFARVLVAICIAIPAAAADPPGFALWKAGDLAQHDKALSTHVGADHSSRETLADYGDHRFRMLYRDADGNPEQHDTIIDIVLVQSGESTLVMGGTMAGRRATTAGEWWARASMAATVTRLVLATSSTSQPGFRMPSWYQPASTSPTCC